MIETNLRNMPFLFGTIIFFREMKTQYNCIEFWKTVIFPGICCRPSFNIGVMVF